MIAKFVFALAVVAAVSAADYSAFTYRVGDPYTGDYKNQYECLYGNKVQGQYSLLEPDGTRRTVEYIADADGFRAIVKKDPASTAAAPAPFTAPDRGYNYPYPYNFDKFGAYGDAAPYAFERYY